MLLATISTARIPYIIAFGDVIVGEMRVRSAAEEVRSDEKVDIDANRVHIVTGLRNVLHSFLVPYPGLAGPIWMAVTATVADRFRQGRGAMDSIFSGCGNFWTVQPGAGKDHSDSFRDPPNGEFCFFCLRPSTSAFANLTALYSSNFRNDFTTTSSYTSIKRRIVFPWKTGLKWTASAAG